MKTLMLLLFSCLSLNAQILVGGGFQFSATCTYKPATGTTVTTETCGTAKDANGDLVAWVSSEPNVASINAEGLLTGVSIGTTTVTASAKSKTSNAVAVTVSPATLASVSISSKAALPLALKATSQLEVTCVYGNKVRSNCNTPNANGNMVARYEISATKSTVLSINSAGLMTALAAGTSNVTVVVGSVTSNTLAVTVK